MDIASYEADKKYRWWFQEGEDGADSDLAEWPAEIVCDLTYQ